MRVGGELVIIVHDRYGGVGIGDAPGASWSMQDADRRAQPS